MLYQCDTSDTALTISAATASADITTASPIIRRRVRLNNIDQNSLVFKLPTDVIKTLKTDDNSNITDTNHKVRRTFVDTLDQMVLQLLTQVQTKLLIVIVRQTLLYR